MRDLAIGMSAMSFSRCCLLILAVGTYMKIPLLCEAAHSRTVIVRRPSSPAKQYDREITTFDPSGRLLQVEYSLLSAARGSSLAGFISENDSVIVLVGKQKENGSDNHCVDASKVHRIDEHVYLFTSGLAGDALFLANLLRNYSQNHRIQYGEAPTVAQVAKHASQVQHSLTRTGGARPLGCSALVAGIDDSIREGTHDRARLCCSHPGGVLEHLVYGAIGKNADAHMELLKDHCVNRGKSDKKRGNNDSLMTRLKRLLNGFGDKSSDGCDVWVLQHDPSRRGETSATCFANATPSSAERIAATLLELGNNPSPTFK